MPHNVPETHRERIVVIGAGFAGMTLVNKLKKSNYDIVLLDKNNYHQFQPLFYQVAMAGLEPSSISFPIRKAFQGYKNIHIRVAEVQHINTKEKTLTSPLGILNYDHLVIANGATTHFFGNEEFRKNTYPLKSVSESLSLRNAILMDYEQAVTTRDYDVRQGLIDIVIVGGGPTGVELAGALAEMKKYILPKDYHELDNKEIDIYLIQSGPRLLPGMSNKAGLKAEAFLRKMGVHVLTNSRVTDYDGEYVLTDTGLKIRSEKVIWAAGITANKIEGLASDILTFRDRIQVDLFHRVQGYDDVYAIGDIAFMKTVQYPDGHPQVAQVAIQQAKNLARNFKKQEKKKFRYKDLGSMATIGRNKAVCDLPSFKFTGFFAWIVWLFVHLYALIGVKNKVFVFINWLWNYMTYDQSLRIILKAKETKDKNGEY